MKKIALGVGFWWLSVSQFLALAQDVGKGYDAYFLPRRNYVVYQTLNDLHIDGKGDEASWKKAEWTGDFADIEGDKKPQPLHPTRVKMLWDHQCLYILAELTEPHIWSYYTTRDQIVYHENDFEIFIDPDNDTHNYYEFELNAANTLFDLFLPKPYRNGGQPLISWNSAGFRSAVFIDGTLNNPADTDRQWTVEMAIPFASMNVGDTVSTPVDGQIWRINFSRVNWQTEGIDGKYQRKKDEKTGRPVSEYNWVWSPTGEINMHTPERWGMLQFSGNSVKKQSNGFLRTADQEYRDLLWLIYYRQHDFRRKNGRFADSVSELSFADDLTKRIPTSAQVKIVASEKQFTVRLFAENKVDLSVNENGLIRNNQPNQ